MYVKFDKTPVLGMMQAISLDAGGASARLLAPAGGRVASLRLMPPHGVAVDVLHPYPEDFFDPVHWAKGGIYPLMPYSNRIENAQLLVGGEPVSLQPHPDAGPHTLHGNAHTQAWQIAQAGPATATMTLDSPASPAWPWAYQARQHFDLTASQLAVTLTLTNASARKMPAGIGLHPYFRHETRAKLGHNARRHWPANSDFFPSASRILRPEESHAAPRPLAEGTMTDYFSDWDGVAHLELPGGSRLKMACDPVFAHFVVHRPPVPAYLCLEPVSHVTNAFNLAAKGCIHTGSQLLEPGQSLTGQIHLSIE